MKTARTCKHRIAYAIRAADRRATLAHRARREARRAAGIITASDYHASGLDFINPSRKGAF